MKIRNGFVSNSSSSSFTFIHKGENLEELYNQINKWNQYFDLRYTNYNDETATINANDVINEIKKLGEDPATPITWKIEDYIIHLETELQRTQNYLTKLMKDGKHNNDFVMEYIFKMSSNITELEDLAKRGFRTVHTISFGDNHGNISGEGVGEVMDYEGRNIYINKEDFVVFTEQDR